MFRPHAAASPMQIRSDAEIVDPFQRTLEAETSAPWRSDRGTRTTMPMELKVPDEAGLGNGHGRISFAALNSLHRRLRKPT